MKTRTIGKIAQTCGGFIFGIDPDKEINTITLDSRECADDSLFIAINNRLTDNCCFISDAISRGSVILSESVQCGYPTILVDESEIALQKIASYCRKKEAGKVLAITGSVGKTSVKEICVSILRVSEKIRVKATDGNKNNLLGLPMTLFKSGISDVTVLEVGISEPGEMSTLSKISKPDIAVITCAGRMHAETLGPPQSVAREKLKIAEFMPENGTLIVPSDDPNLCSPSVNVKNIMTVGYGKNSDVRIFNVQVTTVGTLFSVEFSDGKRLLDMFIPIIGSHGAYDAALAVTSAVLLGCSEPEIRNGLSSYTPCGDRQKLLHHGKITVISDCYNSGPESLRAALEAFPQFISGCKDTAPLKVLLLADMLELGVISEVEHRLAGKKAAELSPDMLIAYGSRAIGFIEGAIEAGLPADRCHHFGIGEENSLFDILGTLKNSSAAILVKGSRAMKAERFVDYLMR